jgi:hypothetical protein
MWENASCLPKFYRSTMFFDHIMILPEVMGGFGVLDGSGEFFGFSEESGRVWSVTSSAAKIANVVPNHFNVSRNDV